jgi:hypothetical protein
MSDFSSFANQLIWLSYELLRKTPPFSRWCAPQKLSPVLNSGGSAHTYDHDKSRPKFWPGKMQGRRRLAGGIPLTKKEEKKLSPYVI